MSDPVLTIGISFYNTADTLEDLVRCIFSQTFTDWEFILIDDGSTDNPMDFLKRVDDSRITVISDGENKGMARRYNEITKMAKGKYIARLDADDICDPTRFEKQVFFLNRNPQIDVVSTDMYSLDPEGNFKGLCHMPEVHEDIFNNPVKRVNCFHGPLMARKEWFEKFPYNVNYRVAVDYALYVSSYAHSKYAGIPEPLYYYRVYETHNFKKYYNTTVSYIDIIRKNPYQGVSFLNKTIEIAQRYARIVIYAIADKLKLNDYLISNREVEKITDDEKIRCEKVLEKIKQTKIPGVDKLE